AGEGIEVDRRVEPSAVEEVLPPILGCDESEASVRNQLLDGACRHLELLFSKDIHGTHGPFREDRRARRQVAHFRRPHLHYHAPRGPPVDRGVTAQMANSTTPARVAAAPASLSPKAL